MANQEAILELKANPAFQDLRNRIRAKRQSSLERLPQISDQTEWLKLSGRCLELEDLDNELTQLIMVRHDLETGPPREEI